MEYLVKVEGDITEKAMAEIQPGIVRQCSNTHHLSLAQPYSTVAGLFYAA